ncbi:MAG: GspH/FimT family pseudopilin [Gammaproteobacteria bacterium]|nr:GspH/FimT family pseudopilin [Gammaproteobacteria bacterium]
MDLLSFLTSVRFYPQPTCRCTCYSMTEVLTTLAVAGVVISSGVPAMQNLVYEQRLTTQINQLFADLYLARSESIKRSVQVTLCKSNDGAICSTISDWRDGWIVFADTNGNEAVDAGETIIRVGQALAAGTTLRYGTSYSYVYYKPDGAAWPNATFTFCDPRGAANARAIILSNTGRARISDKSSSDGPLSCS